MNKKCAKCSKTVYPTEELKCLDKIWHKFCFKCEVCGMTLNMKNYKGYDKLPYCNAHYPTTKPTAVADTPETRRIAENTKIQSNIQYHADFERQKGHKTSVADDPETSRIRQNTQIQSNVSYWGLKEQRDHMEGKRPNEMVDDVSRRSRNPGKISDYDPTEHHDFDAHVSQRSSANVVYDSQRGEEQRSPIHKSGQRPGIGGYAPFSYGGSGSPPGGHPNRASHGQVRSGYEEQRSSYGESQQAPYSYAAGRDGYTDNSPRNSYGPSSGGGGYGDQRASYGSDRYSGSGYGAGTQGYGDARTSYREPMHGQRIQPGSIADYDPLNQKHSSVVRNNYGPPQPVPYQPAPPQVQPPRAAQPAPKQVVYRALYDYTAADVDEVSFMDGDHIVNVDVVDAGWMTGTVQRTGQQGMLPSNYVERVN